MKGWLLVCDTESGDHYYGPVYTAHPGNADELARKAHPEEQEDGHWYVYGSLVEVDIH
jgi:hypothetical protein